MSVKGLSFSEQMAAQYRAGNKDITRRIVNKKYDNTDIVLRTDKYGTRLVELQNDTPPDVVTIRPDGAQVTTRHIKACCEIEAPYKPGDTVYIRESWRIGAWDYGRQSIAVDYRDDIREEWIHVPDLERFERYVSQSFADARKAGILPNGKGEVHWVKGEAPTRWRPPRFMPREVARDFGIIKDVRPERVQDISEAEAIREGFRPMGGTVHAQGAGSHDRSTPYYASAREGFLAYFDSLNMKRDPAFAVAANPWVWVYTLEHIPMPEGWPNA
jgi:hypothetical protein